MSTSDIPHLELGHALITMVEPERATVVEYNEWYERDHFLSGVLTGPGAFAGRRFVADRELKRHRSPDDSPIARPIANGTFIALYWIERGQLQTHWDWGFPEAVRLGGLGRMRTDRAHISTDYYDVIGVGHRDERPVPAELALHHPYGALVMAWTSGDGDAGALRDALVVDGSAFATAVTCRPHPLPAGLGAMPGAVGASDIDPSTVLAHCCFVDAHSPDPAQLHSMVAHAVAESGLQPLLIAPFVPVVPGTDPVAGNLW